MTSIEFLGITDTTEDPKYAVALRKNVGAFAEALKVFEDADLENRQDWKLKAEIKGDKCFNKHFPVGKVYTLQKEFPLPVNVIFGHHWNDVEKTNEWNQNVQSVQRVATLTPHADILHYATSDVVIVKGRDFVVLRQWRPVGESYVVCASSFDTDIPALPRKKRGWANMVSGRFSPHPTDPNKSIVTYLVSVDFKDTLLPKAVVSSGIADMTIKDARNAHKHIEEELAKQNAEA